MWQHVNDGILHMLATHPAVRARMTEIECQLAANEITPGMAAERLLRAFLNV